MTLRVLIADDEDLARHRLRRFLEEEPGIEVVGECATGAETLKAIRNLAPDLILLDVQMPELDGFQVIQAVGPDRMPAIIFVTAHGQFAVKAFEASAVDYLLKPFDRVRLKEALRRVRSASGRGTRSTAIDELLGLLGSPKDQPRLPERLSVRSGGRISFVRLEEIEWIQSADNYCELHVGKAVHLLRQTLTTLGHQLQGGQFVRISRSLMVNLDHIKELRMKSHGDYLVVLCGGQELTASRNYRHQLLERVGKPG